MPGHNTLALYICKKNIYIYISLLGSFEHQFKGRKAMFFFPTFFVMFKLSDIHRKPSRTSPCAMEVGNDPEFVSVDF